MKTLLQLVNGFLIGIANVIPGVSGGTFLLVLGVFDRVVESLKSIDLRTVRIFLGLPLGLFRAPARRAFAEEWRRIDATFLGLLAAGAAAAIVSCAWLLDYLLTEHPSETLAFFVGLILPSLAVPWRMMDRRGPAQLAWIVPGAALTVAVSLAHVGGGGGTPPALLVFAGGVVAVSAMILPGISGSFCLLVLGLYQPTLGHIKALVHAPGMESFRFLGLLGAGIAVGFVTFTRLMSWLLRRFRSATLAFLIGLILGSFWVLWPVKDYEAAPAEAAHMKRKIRIATAPNRLPGDREGDGALCLRLALAALAGAAGAAGMNRLGRSNRESGAGEPQG